MIKRVPSSLLLIPLACLLSGCVAMSYHARDPAWGLGFSETGLAPGYGYAYAGSGSAFVAAYSYPETGLLVSGLSEKPAGGGQMVFDAAFVSTEIKRKYQIKG